MKVLQEADLCHWKHNFFSGDYLFYLLTFFCIDKLLANKANYALEDVSFKQQNRL